MESRAFNADYSGIRRRMIIGIVTEFLFTVAYGIFSLWFYSIDIYRQHQALDELLLVILGILLAHVILSVIFFIRESGRAIRSVTVTEDGLEINGQEYRADFDPDDLRGTGFNFSAGILQVIMPSAGQELIVISSDGSGRQIRKFFWTGPLFDKDAKKLRSDLVEFIREGSVILNDSRFSRVREIIKTRSVNVKINKAKLKKDAVKYSCLTGVFIAVIVAAAIVNIHSLPTVVFMLGSAVLLSAYWVDILMKNKANSGNLLSELKLTDRSLTAGNDIYALKDLKIDIFSVGKHEQDSRGSIRTVSASDRNEVGIYLILSDSGKSNRYWLGPQMDSEAAAAVILLNYARSIAEEINEGYS